MSDPDPALIFPEDDIEHPMESILNAPVLPDRLRELGGSVRKTADLIALFDGDRLADAEFPLNQAHTLKSCPGLRLIQPGEVVRIMDQPGTATLEATIAFLQRLVGVAGKCRRSW